MYVAYVNSDGDLVEYETDRSEYDDAYAYDDSDCYDEYEEDYEITSADLHDYMYGI